MAHLGWLNNFLIKRIVYVIYWRNLIRKWPPTAKKKAGRLQTSPIARRAKWAARREPGGGKKRQSKYPETICPSPSFCADYSIDYWKLGGKKTRSCNVASRAISLGKTPKTTREESPCEKLSHARTNDPMQRTERSIESHIKAKRERKKGYCMSLRVEFHVQ